MKLQIAYASTAERGTENKCSLRGVLHSSCLCQWCHLKIHSSKCALMQQHSPQLWSQPTVKPALWSALRGQTVKGYTKTEIAPKPCHSWCINSLLLDGFLGSHTKMPNSRWTKPQDRKFTLFPVFTDDKAFLTVTVLCFQKGWGIHCYLALQHGTVQNHSPLVRKFAILMLLPQAAQSLTWFLCFLFQASCCNSNDH